MIKNQKYLDIEYLGSEKIQVSEYENKICNFYLIKREEDTDRYYNICNKDYFIIKDSKRIKENRSISYEECEMVVIKDEIIINEEIFKCSKKKTIDKNIKEDFLYSLALYYIKNEDRKSGQDIIAQIGDIYIYKLLDKDFGIEEKNKAKEILELCIKDRENRFKEGKASIKLSLKNNENQCLIEILNEILNDDYSALLWDYSYEYNRITLKNNMIEDNYVFIKPKVGYGEVTNMIIGSQKLNIGVKVKVEGQVINKDNNLKLDSHIFREYAVVVNGKLNVSFIWCKLSNKLKTKFKKQKLIKAINNIYNEEIITLDLSKINITSGRLLRSLDIDTIAEYLYKVEELKLRQGIINKLIKNYNSNIKGNIDENKGVVQRYRVDKNGLYHPLSIVKNNSESEFQVYLAKILEWKIEKFPKKKEENKILEEYSILISEDKDESLYKLYDKYNIIKKERQYLEYKINVVRLSCGLMRQSIFIWEEESEKEKTEIDKILNINAIIGAKVKVCTKTINNISIRQNSYSILTRCE